MQNKHTNQVRVKFGKLVLELHPMQLSMFERVIQAMAQAINGVATGRIDVNCERFTQAAMDLPKLFAEHELTYAESVVIMTHAIDSTWKKTESFARSFPLSQLLEELLNAISEDTDEERT